MKGDRIFELIKSKVKISAIPVNKLNTEGDKGFLEKHSINMQIK